jgi:predicted adenine nucleotide alpha hydrolase (AANH) superfamily ATPase
MKNKLVLHICCAPDEAWGIESLYKEYDLYCFFYNPNIHPEDEYRLRLKESERIAAHFNIPFAHAPYEPHLWADAVNGLAHSKEGEERCRECFLLRLRRTAQFCKEISVPYFATVMSVSPHKKIGMINETGNIAAKEHGVEFLELDLKKNDGFKKSIELSNELFIYRQNYCGCILSRNERDIRKNNRKTA